MSLSRQLPVSCTFEVKINLYIMFKKIIQVFSWQLVWY